VLKVRDSADTTDVELSALLDATQITKGVLDLARIPTIHQAIITEVGADRATTSTSFVDLLSSSITTEAAKLFMGFTGGWCWNDTRARHTYFRILLDGVAIAPVDASGHMVVGYGSGSEKHPASCWLVADVTAGTHTVTVQFRVDGGTGYASRRCKLILIEVRK